MIYILLHDGTLSIDEERGRTFISWGKDKRPAEPGLRLGELLRMGIFDSFFRYFFV